MTKYLQTIIVLIALIFCLPAHAVEIMRTSIGYVFMVESDTGKHCWGMPQNVDLSYFPTSPMEIEQAAIKYKWPAPTGEQFTACQTLLADIWTVQPYKDLLTRPVYAVIGGSKTNERIDVIPVGAQCGTLVQAYSSTIKKLTWRMVTGSGGKQGAAVCEQAQ